MFNAWPTVCWNIDLPQRAVGLLPLLRTILLVNSVLQPSSLIAFRLYDIENCYFCYICAQMYNCTWQQQMSTFCKLLLYGHKSFQFAFTVGTTDRVASGPSGRARYTATVGSESRKKSRAIFVGGLPFPGRIRTTPIHLTQSSSHLW